MDARTDALGQVAIEGGRIDRDGALYLAERAPLRDLLYRAGEVRSRQIIPVRFVPLTGGH